MRRRDGRTKFIVLGVFTAVFLFTLLAQAFRGARGEVGAASLANFDPGYIISDYQMGNYNSMSEEEIQEFLTSKNSCANTNYNYYLSLSANKNYTWHFENGHFVCLSEELFGDGEVIGEGETAAKIIYQAAQDYKINPQVLIVLLQKETGLITDPIPNDKDYRKATGYGCPDTAPCASEYYGFKNQVRKAAELFSAVLNGGWTNYPLGENYIQYNPSASCGGSVVNIRSLATSALYRYTPYQPNAGALAAGYGTAYCGAYGNRNFYLYFEDWFGGIVEEGVWQEMANPRVMTITMATLMVNPITRQVYDGQWAEVGYKFKFESKIDVYWGDEKEVCLRTAEDTAKNVDRCIIMSRMEETGEELYETEEIEKTGMILKTDAYKYDLLTGDKIQKLSAKDYGVISFSEKVSYNGKDYYRTTYDVVNENNYFILASDLKEIEFTEFVMPRNLLVTKENAFINLAGGASCKEIKVGYVDRFVMKTMIKGEIYYRTEDDTEAETSCVVPAKYTKEVESFERVATLEDFRNFLYPRNLRLVKNSYLIDIKTGKTCDEYMETGEVRKYTTKIDIGKKVYFRDEINTEKNTCCVVEANNLSEL